MTPILSKLSKQLLSKKSSNFKLPNKKQSLDIEPIEKDSEDYKEIQAIKAENNPKYY